MNMPFARMVLLSVVLLSLGCGGGQGSDSTLPLSPTDLNLLFVVSPDLAYQTPGDLQPETANLSPQGLQRSLLLASYLKQQVMGGHNVDGIYALSPMTHLQTENKHPDMAAIGFVQQFSVLNQITIPIDAQGTTVTGNNHPIHVAYSPGSVPSDVLVPTKYCPDRYGLAFNDTKGNNAALVAGIIRNHASGYHVFSAPWETIRALLADISSLQGYGIQVPTTFAGSNRVYALTLAPSGAARLLTCDTGLQPLGTFPVLPAPVPINASSSTQQAYFSTVRTGGVSGALVPANINKNQKVYIIRHAEAHPDPAHKFEDGNIVAAGQWRALALADALRGKARPTMVWSSDPAQWLFTGYLNMSYVRPSLTVLPYAIANNLPYELVAGFSLTDPNVSKLTSDFFFTGGRFSNQTLLLAWESSRIKPMLNALLATYGGSGLALLPTAWPSADYDTIWAVRLDAQGNVTVDDELCEGIDSDRLPVTAPWFN